MTIKFGKELHPDTFNDYAEDAAKLIANNSAQGSPDKDKDKPTQLRRFYDELCMWQEKVGTSDEKYVELAPYIKMLNAKLAYAEGRKHVSSKFRELFRDCLKEVSNAETLRHCKLFMEAFMGFYKGMKG